MFTKEELALIINALQADYDGGINDGSLLPTLAKAQILFDAM